MEQKTRQILTATAVLASVTVLSFGVRHIRVVMHRTRIAEEPVSSDAGSKDHSGAEPVASAQSAQPRGQVDISIDGYQQFTDLSADEIMAYLEEAFAEAKEEDYPGEEKEQYDARKHLDKSTVVTLNKYSKKVVEYEKTIESIPMKLSDTETLYTGKAGEYWYVQKLPDGGVTKMQMQEVDGELQPVSEGQTYAPKGGESKSGGDNDK